MQRILGMTMGMEFPMRMEIPREFNGYAWKKIQLGNGNGKDWEWHIFLRRKYLQIFLNCCRSALGCRPILCTVALFHRSWHNILKDGCRNIFVWLSKYCEWRFKNFYFSTIMSSFFVELFFCCSTVDCLHVLFFPCVFGNVMGIGTTILGIPWEWE